MQSEIRIAKEGAFVREKPPSKLPIRTTQKNLPVGGFSGGLSLHPNHVSVTYKAPLPTSRHQVKSPLSGKQRSAFSAVRSRRQRSVSPAPSTRNRRHDAVPNSRQAEPAPNPRIGCVQNTISYLAAPNFYRNKFIITFFSPLRGQSSTAFPTVFV